LLTSAEFHVPEIHRTRLLNALQYGQDNAELSNTDSTMLDAYMEYICTRLLRSSTDPIPVLTSLIDLFITVVEYFGKLNLVNHTVEQYLKKNDEALRRIFHVPASEDKTFLQIWRRRRVNDVVSSIALWTMNEDFHERFGNGSMRESFFRKVKAKPPPKGYEGLAQNDDELDLVGKFTIFSIADTIDLIPKKEEWVVAPEANPHDEVLQTILNARLINRIGRIQFRWTFNTAEHMKLRNDELYLFCMPSRFLLEPSVQNAESSPDLALSYVQFRYPV
jgi:hypothetical protein